MPLSASLADRVAATTLDGDWRAASAEPLDVFDPTNEQVLASPASASADDVEAALASARRAQRSSAATPAPIRGGHLRAMADVIADHADDLAGLIVQEVGKPRHEAEGAVAFAEGFLRYNAEWDRRLEGEILPSENAGEVIHLLRAPIGVVAAICPWNFPLAVLCRKLGPCSSSWPARCSDRSPSIKSDS